MTLRFIFGGSGSGKSYRCIEEITNKKKKGEMNPLILLIPEQLSFKSEKMLLERLGCLGVNNVYSFSFKRLAHTIFNEVGGITHKNLSNTGKAIIVDKILQESKDELKVFSLSAKQSGFVDNIISMINEFKTYNVTVENINEMKNVIDESSLLSDKIFDTSLIYEKYNSALGKDTFDPADTLDFLNEKILKSKFLSGAEIWIDEFYGFTPQQYNIIEKLFKICKRVNITLPYTGSNVLKKEEEFDITDAFYPVFYTENKILKIAAENNISYEKPIILKGNPKNENNYRFMNSDELSYIEKNYFNIATKPYAKEINDIKIFKGLNTYSEIQYVAKEILRLCREKNYRFKDIAVIARNLDSYEDIIKAIFSEYKIPYFLDMKKDVESNPIVIMVKSALEIILKNFSYESVFRYLKSGFVDIDMEDVDVLENYVIAYGIKGEKKYLDEYYWKEEKPKNIKDKFLGPILNLKKSLKKENKIASMCKALFVFLEELNLGHKISTKIEELKEKEQLNDAREYSSIWNLLMEILDELVKVLGEEKITVKQFVSLFNMAISYHEIGIIPPALDQVTIGDIQRIRAQDIKALYIVGVNDGVFPKAKIEDGIFNDLDKKVFQTNGMKLSSDTQTLMFEEQFFIYTALTLPSEKLTLSYPVADFEGKALRQSIIISRIKGILKEVKEESDIVKDMNMDELDDVNSHIPTFNNLIMQIRHYIETEEISPIWGEVYKYFIENEDYSEKAKNIFKGFSYKNVIDAISNEKAKELYDGGNYFTVSKIEKYARCPFAYFIKYGLKAKERKVYGFSAPDLGSFMHNVLDSFSKDMRKEGLKWQDIDIEYCERKVESIVNIIMSEDRSFILNSSFRYKYISERLKRVLVRAVITIMNQINLGEFEPEGYEIGFGTANSEYPPIEIELSNGEVVKLIGRIDRIDKLISGNQVYYRIIDYKSGSKKFRLSDVYYGLQVQLLTYLDAILNRKLNIGEKSNPAGVLYFKIDDPIISVDENMSDEEIESSILKELKMKGLLIRDVEVLREMDEGLENGNKSSIIPVGLKKDGEFTSDSSVISYDGFNVLRKHVRKELINFCEDMLSGDISINPCKVEDDDPCEYCELSAICQFDLSFEENKYRNIKGKKDKEILKILECGEEVNE